MLSKYRPDIDGLRGLAVLAVVGFHAFPSVVPAGFIGVDVFFVISGFLITTIILVGLESGRFSFAAFYARRIRRIFPALVAVLTAVFVAGWFFLTADEYKRLGLHVLGGATFSSNFLLWQESGYFDIASDRKILLHLWSLAIEEQFYLFFPLVLWAAHMRRIRPLIVTSSIGLASFTWNILAAPHHSTMDFYSPQTRIWELMAGAVLASVSLHPPLRLLRALSKAEAWLAKGGRKIPHWPKENALGNLASIVGAYLLVFGVIFIAKEEMFPGWWALLPTIGAALLIFGGASSWVNRRILSHRALVWVGLISFPLYLWHWPLLSFARIVIGDAPSWLLASLLVAAAVLLAWLTYVSVEKPLRFGKNASGATVHLLIWLLSLGVLGFSAWRSEGFLSRPAAHRLETYLQSIAVATGENSCVKINVPGWFCKLGVQAAPPSAFVFGDSHAGSLLPAFARIAHESGGSFLYTLTKACPTEKSCLQDNKNIFTYVRDNQIDKVFIAFRWSNYDLPFSQDARVTQLEAWLDQTVEAYRKIGVHVYLLVDNPLQKTLPEDALRKSRRTDASINTNSITASEYASQQAPYFDLLSRYAGDFVTVLDFTDVYCQKNICPLVRDGKFHYGDLHHVSPDGALLAYPKLKKALGS